MTKASDAALASAEAAGAFAKSSKGKLAKVGDLCKLPSGGPDMTVVSVSPPDVVTGVVHVECAWFSEAGKDAAPVLHRETLPHGAILVKKTEAPKAECGPVSIKATGFTPPFVTVKVGDCVCWKNDDAAVHTVTDDPPGLECSGDVAAGATYERVFDAAGTFSYHCKYMPAMKGAVVVA